MEKLNQQADPSARRTPTGVARSATRRVRDKLKRRDQTRGGPAEHQNHHDLPSRMEAVEREVQELRQLNRRLSDALDVMTELLVPAMDRDDEKVTAALARLGTPR